MESSKYQFLVNFSEGKVSDIEIMDKLGLGSEEELLLIMAKSHLAMPSLPSDQTEKMIADLNDLLS